MDLWILLHLPLSVESIVPEWTNIGVGLMISMAVQAFKRMRAGFAFLHFYPWRVDLVVWFATLSKLSVILGLVRAVALDAFWALDSAWKSSMSPFPAVLALRDPRVHVHSLDCNNVLSYIEALINEHFGVAPTLNIPYVDPHNGHVRFGWYLDDSRFRS